ncbi:DUF4192 domain-containing protein [Saccharothrix variisporea]|uniref:Uncharacterized protein DUF4192 n=1 Tax=Saccharothrix variisporea TaxID=543527 RepID=A0A495X6Y3_9PSEU|nr:DUF4192 domain-containing protein [Saccharothrix variisporea]RKT69742.1 uncharacterized protein DUF4192 [Saccharothrix variisporea]
MTTSVNVAGDVRTPGELVAALPHLIGFHPTESVVLVVLVGQSVEQTLRADLPDPVHDRRAADHLAAPLRQYPNRRRAVALVVGGGRGDPPERLPREHLVAHVEASLAEVGVPVTCAIWTPATAKDAPWFNYHDLGDEGTVPDPTTTTLAAMSVAKGLITYPNRDSLADTLNPDPEEDLTRRSQALDRLVAEHRALAHDDPTTLRRHHALVHAEITRARDRKRPLTDAEVAALTFALSDLVVRDASLGYAVGEHARDAETLWAELTRASPLPERAEPATLLAFSAYIRGDGAYASIALDRALEAQADHRLATLLHMALEKGLPPATVRQLAERAAGLHPDES